jgi:branched-chain amino acid transport system permease protein
MASHTEFLTVPPVRDEQNLPFAIVSAPACSISREGSFYWGPLLGGGIETWFAYVIALGFLVFRPQGLFGEKIIERI